MEINESRRRSLPPLHSPSLSEYSSASSSHPLDKPAITLARSPSSSSSSHGGQEAGNEQTFIASPPPPQPLEYESPVPSRRPLPLPPTRVSPKRPPLPHIPAPDAGGKGKARIPIMDEEKQRYARALGLDTVGEENDGLTSPTSPPGYVQNRDADAREGLSKGVRVHEEEMVVDEKGRGELARVAEAQQKEAEDELAQDSSEEKARMARAEAERSEDVNPRRQAVDSAELVKEVSQLSLGDGKQTPPPPISFVSPDPPGRGDYPIDSKELPSRSSLSDSLFDSSIDDVPTYEAEAFSHPPPPQHDLSELPSTSRDYGEFFPPHGLQQQHPMLPPPPEHYAAHSTSSAFPPPSSAPQHTSSSYLMFSSPAAPPPTSYVADRPLPPPETDNRRPLLARHMSLQPAAGRPYIGTVGATSFASAAYAPPVGEDRRWPLTRASVGPGGSGGFYSSGIGISMHKEVAPVFESSTIGSAFRRSPSPLRSLADETGAEFGEGRNRQYSPSYSSRASGQWGATPLAPPSGFAQANPADYRQHFAQQGFQPPPIPPLSPHIQPQVHSAIHQPSPAPVQAPPIVSAAGLQPAGYFTFSPGSAPIPFYNTSPISPLPPTTSSGVFQSQQQPSYFPAAPLPNQPIPSRLPPPPPPHSGYAAFSAHSQHQQQPYPPPHTAQSASSAPLARPPSAISQSQNSIRATSRGSVRALFGRKGKKGKNSPALEETGEVEGSKVLLWGWT